MRLFSFKSSVIHILFLSHFLIETISLSLSLDPGSARHTPHIFLRLRSHTGTSTYTGTVVRARYQNRNLILPMCADDDKHLAGSPEFCTLNAFRERVDELAPRDWEAECAVGSGAV